ncbi:MAG TPA: hypothetical protein VG323_11195 [Thermoanaerobaculia bacterium]|nr:hypothetical protein [Thermoanaerobaculia bacterium]
MSKWRRWIAIAVAVYLLLVLYDRFVLVELFFRRGGVALGAAAFEALALIGCGFAVRGLVARRWEWSELDLARDLLVGYPIFGGLCFLLGLLNVSGALMLALVLVAGVWGIYAVVRRFESRPGKLSAAPWPIVVLAVVGFAMAQAPPSSLDELAYHLAVPWTWVKEGRAIALPLLSHSYFPLGIESADLPLLSLLGALRGGIASHFLHLGAAIATAAVAWKMTERNALATMAIISTPALMIAAGWSLVDWPLVGLALIAFEAVDDDARFAAAVGAGLLTKYTFVPIAILLLARRRRAILPAAAIGCLFFVRNLILTGNPIAPFFTSLAPHVAHYRDAASLSDYVFDGKFIDESLGASILALLPLASGLVPIVLAVAAVALFFLAPSARILLPYLSVAGVSAAKNLAQSRALRVVLAIAVAVQLFLVAFFVDRGGVFALLGGTQSDEEYLVKARASYVTIESIDALAPPGALILVVGLNETYWFEHRVRGGGNFDGPRVSAYLEEATPDALHAKLRRDGITHVAVVSLPPPTTVGKKLEERETALSPGAQRMLAQTLDQYAAGVASRGAATLFTLR